MNEINITRLDERTFEMFFKDYFKDMVFSALRYVKDLDTAREITHDAFVALWMNRETYDMSKPVKAWLAVTIHNKCLNYLRDNNKFDRYILAFENLVTEPDGNYDKMVSDETISFIYRTIDELPGKCREVFKLNRFENKKYQEIADELGISVKTVETQMSKALQHMRTKLLPYLKMLIIMFF